MTSVPERIRPGRSITGMSAVLLPHMPDRTIDWTGFETLVVNTVAAGLKPAVNMDTGFVQLLDEETVLEVLDRTTTLSDGDFVAGAFVADSPGDPFDPDRYEAVSEAIASRGGTPVIFPSHGLNGFGDEGWLDGYQQLASRIDRFIGFELGPMFVPYGRIVDLDTYRQLLAIPQCIGAKHSSLKRDLEWDRLSVRDEVRPEFMVLTGNDLAIDMVMYGSDYLLGLSTMAPDCFAERDRLWAAGDPGFYELNDSLQYLGDFAFRPPVPGYRHNAAMFLALRGWIASGTVPFGAVQRSRFDRDVLVGIASRLGVLPS